FSQTASFLYVFGGQTLNGISDEFWRLNFTSRTWERFTKSSNTEWPPGREGAQMSTYPPSWFTNSADNEQTDATVFIFLTGGRLSDNTVEDGRFIWRCRVDENSNASVQTITWERISIRENGGSYLCVYDVASYYLWQEMIIYSGRTIRDGATKLVDQWARLDFSHAISDDIDSCYVDITIIPTTETGPLVQPALYYAVDLDRGKDSDVDLYLYGGIGPAEINSNLSILYRKTSKSKTYLVSYPTPTIPPARTYHSALVAQNKMWIFGGIGSARVSLVSWQTSTDFVYLNDLYSFDFSSAAWTMSKPRSTKPSARAHTSFCEYGGSLYVFGGLGPISAGGESEPLNDLWCYSIEMQTWQQIYPIADDKAESTNKPSGVYGAGSCLQSRNLFVFGGLKADQKTSDELWKFSLFTRKWTKCKFDWYEPNQSERTKESPDPEPRSHCTIFILNTTVDGKYREVLVIYGGVSASGESIDSYEIYVLSDPTDYDGEDFTLYKLSDLDDSSSNSGKYNSYTDSVVATYPSGIIRMYGLETNNLVGSISVCDFSDVRNPLYLASTVNLASRSVGVGATAVYRGRSVYVFGGRIAYHGATYDQHFLNDLFQFNLSVSFPCSHGTCSETEEACKVAAIQDEKVCHLDDSKNPSSIVADGCLPVKAGYRTNNGAVEECWAGTHSEYPGSSRGSHCLPCPHGTYSEKGQSTCTQCEHGQCPPFSIHDNFSQPDLENASTQPQFLKTQEVWETRLQLICFIGGLLLGIIVACIVRFCPSRSALLYCDLFSNRHNNPLNPETHSAPLILRKSPLGGMVAIVFVVFAVCVLGFYVWRYFWNNTGEVKTLLSYQMDKDYDFTHPTTESMKLLVTLIDFKGTCDKDHLTQTTEHKCIPDWQTLNYSNHPSLNEPTTLSDCTITTIWNNPTLSFNSDSSRISITLRSTEPESYARAIRVIFETHSGINGFDTPEESMSNRTDILYDKDWRLFHGSDPSVFTYTVSGSVFEDKRTSYHR
ncbi:MAG: hypothetical protein J5614_05715, partial [Paludibacteraceae bacterium]|nr:hypothetical protein [Paludibacteraceae bacterium]